MMERPARKPTRLKNYDYSQNGANFVTICTENRELLFGEVRDGAMHLNDVGEIVSACWNDLGKHYPEAEYDAFVIMPNHIHAVIVLVGGDQRQSFVGEGLRPSRVRPHCLPQIIASLKSYSARRINERRSVAGAAVWQRSYHDHIIRDEEDLNIRRLYILNNPSRWQEDSENPTRR